MTQASRIWIRSIAALLPLLGIFWASARAVQAEPGSKLAASGSEPEKPGVEPSESEHPWCAPELISIGDHVCFFSPESIRQTAADRTLVIFLHSLVAEGSSWTWDQQRLMMRTATSYGFSALIPRGRAGFGPGRDPKVLAWPTARALQELHEDALIAEWVSAQKQVEKKEGTFGRVFVFGFSNGAYYATSLALRGRLKVSGYAAFAGGNGGKYHRLLAKSAGHRVPIFVGYGTKDPDHPRQRNLVRLLREIGWPHAARSDRIGHTVSDAQIRGALSFLGHVVPSPTPVAGQ